ncbi:Ribonuclease H domain [Macleaya cordata]|uniref:Ribonuclease H domain n=1 Tax=Macleaya cordata TaxID=56857 RepID=A0A200QHI7_MACCD|nr:Ribonuclease H domain [Macleaya cordata]
MGESYGSIVSKRPCPIHCVWIPPIQNQIRIACDGSSRGNPGLEGAGFVARDYKGQVVAAHVVGMGITTNFVGEICAIICGLEWAKDAGINNVWIVSDSKPAINCILKNKVPWFLRPRWENLLNYIPQRNFSHVHREINFGADQMARKGATLARGHRLAFDSRPIWLRVESQNVIYYRFKL